MSRFRATCSRLAALFVIVQAAVLGAAGRHAVADDYTFKDLYTLGVPPAVPSTPTLYSPGSGGVVAGHIGSEATLFTPSNPSGISLSSNAYATATNGAQQVGTLLTSQGLAAMWNSTADSFVALNPTTVVNGVPVSWPGSVAVATDGAQQVGAGTPPGPYTYDAMLWSGSAGSAIDLNPAGFKLTKATGVSGGGQQVGYGVGDGHSSAALLWTGTAASAVDLSPAGSSVSVAYATDGAHQVGYAVLPGGKDAILWSGTAASAVNLGSGIAYAIGAGKEVGWSINGNATVWSGTAASAVNLSALMPAGYFVQPPADEAGSSVFLPMSIDSHGNIFAVAISADNMYHAVEWSPTTPPLAGDVNYDGVVNAQDLALVASGWQQTGTNNANDANGDGIVNAQDLALIGANWMTGATTSNAAVPEPATLILAALGGLALLAWRRR